MSLKSSNIQATRFETFACYFQYRSLIYIKYTNVYFMLVIPT